MSEDEEGVWKQQIVDSKNNLIRKSGRNDREIIKKFPQKPIIKEDVEVWTKRGYNKRLLWTKTNN